jgi:adiponectin receptor
MWGAGISMIYYLFLCDARLRIIYWALMSCAAVGCAIVTLLPKFRAPQYQCWKAATYTCLGLTGLIFIVHGLAVFGWATQNRRLPFAWVAGMAFVNLAGALVFATRVSSCSLRD